MKAIIPVAGIGSKLRPHTHTQPKTLVPIAGKPMLAHIVDRLIAGGVEDFIFVLGYLGNKIEDYLTQYYPNINKVFVVQEPREGSAHAILVAQDYFVQESEILIVLGDTIANVDLPAFINASTSLIGVQKVNNPMRFGIAEINGEGKVQKLVEKPRIPKSNLALVGIYKIANVPLLLEGIKSLMNSQVKINNEYHLTDALMYMVEHGEKMLTVQVDNWFDCGKKETLLEANSILLNRGEFKIDPKDYPDSIILSPVSIGNNCQISNSIVGPNVAIGDNTIINRSIIRESIIGSFSELEGVVLKDSVIGNDSSLKGLIQSLNIGDNTEINFGQ